jgi:hypothetical protein
MAKIGKPKRRIRVEPMPERRREAPPAPREPAPREPATPKREKVPA